MQNLLSIGKILNFHGIKGEVKVGFTQGDEKILSDIKEIYVIKDDQKRTLKIEHVRFHKQFALIKFREINSIDEAMEIKGALLKTPKDQLEKYLEEDEFYITDLIGLNVYDEEDNPLGKVSGVVNLKGQDILLIKDKKDKENMVPFNKEIVPGIDLKAGKIIIHLIEGLF